MRYDKKEVDFECCKQRGIRMKVENWNGYDIRFVEIDGEWYAVLKDICDALGLKSKYVSERLDPDMLERVPIEVDFRSVETTSNRRCRGQQRMRPMLVINELGIYEALFASRRLEARKFRRWAGEIMTKLRKCVGLEQYEVMQMTDPAIQKDIDDILDRLFYDPVTDQLMISVTTYGGYVDQIPFTEVSI